MTPRHLLTLLLAGPALLALQPRADVVGFAPKDGSSLTKEFHIDFDLALGDLTMLANGMDVSEGVPGDFEVTIAITMKVVDTYVDVEDGKPLDLIRLYDSMAARWETPDDSGEADEGPLTELEGKQVQFRWDADAETYDVSYHDCEGDESALEDLGVDMDLRMLLPDSEVSEGDSWMLEPEQVRNLILFGSDTGELSPDMEDDPMGIGPLIESELLPQIESLLEELSAECTYKGRREVDGTAVGAIEVTLEGEGSIDLSGLIRGLIDSQVPEGMDIAVEIDEAVVSLTLEGEGTLLWDLGAGRLHSFEMSPELEILIDVALTVEAAGESQEFEASVELLGSGDWTAEAVR